MPVATTITTDVALLRLMQLSSASLPVGAYSFSQGLEYAVEAGWICSQQQTSEWLSLLLQESLAKVDLPLLLRLIEAVSKKNTTQFYYWNASVLACRETKELLLTETATGTALMRLLAQLDIELPIKIEDRLTYKKTLEHNKNSQAISFTAAFALAVVHWDIDRQSALVGYLWSWLENQVAAATKLVPLGQTSAQALLIELGETIPALIEKSKSIADDEIGASLPGLTMASAWHETQYSRLFRS